MKKLFIFGILVALMLIAMPAVAFTCSDTPLTTDLLAGQTTKVGTVTVCNDDTNLYVTFTTTGTYKMRETHLAVESSISGIPQTKKGNPIPGQFEYTTSHVPVVNTYTYTVSLASLGAGPFFIAAHASLDKENTMTFYSDADGKTMVTALDGVPVAPFAAVDAWEYTGDPVDSTPSGWDNALTMKVFPPGDWIWETYRTVDPTKTRSVTFENAFTIPGEPTSGTLWIADDNMYNAKLNTIFVGEQTNYNNWATVGMYDLLPALTNGENVLQVVGTNYGASGYTIDSNPAGLIFKGEVNYLVPSETAWGDGTGFAGANWATYFTYTPIYHGCTPVEIVNVLSNGNAVESSALESGSVYRMDASGTYRFANWGEAGIADAECSFRIPGSYNPTSTNLWVSGDALGVYPSAGATWLEVDVNGADVNWNSGEDTCDTTAHTYSSTITGTGNSVTFKIFDDAYGDNSGSITVDICKVY